MSSSLKNQYSKLQDEDTPRFALPRRLVNALTILAWVAIAAVIFLLLTVLQGLVIGPILGPRIVGKAVGLHPIVAIFAILAGGELFGLLGALFAVPIAGVIQTIFIALWSSWRELQPEQFPQEIDVATLPDPSIEPPTA